VAESRSGAGVDPSAKSERFEAVRLGAVPGFGMVVAEAPPCGIAGATAPEFCLLILQISERIQYVVCVWFHDGPVPPNG